MIGGFLGAGKTTSILAIAQRLADRGLRVGLISNDQSVGLVDTAMFGSKKLPTEEISGGCFCCRFNSLVEAAERLTADAAPEVFLAEPVGSCTDLQATVGFPLRRLYGEQYSVAPLSVLVDPVRAQYILGLRQGKQFSAKVAYIYQKQLEEAELIVINKCDLLEAAELEQLESALRTHYPKADVLRISARTGDGIEEWMELVEQEQPAPGTVMDVDYELYAEGEALLGWVNLSGALSTREEDFDGNGFLREVLESISQRLEEMEIEVAHLKATLAPSEGMDLAVGNVVRRGGTAELSHELSDPVIGGDLLVNLRAEGDPAVLREIVECSIDQAVQSFKVDVRTGHVEAFRPAPPTPTHRVSSVS